MESNYETKKKGITMNPLTQFKTIRVLLLLITVPLVIGRSFAIDTSPDHYRHGGILLFVSGQLLMKQ